MSSVEVRTTTRTDPVDVCIYCGDTDGLTDEHIIPFALGGNIILSNASCRACAKITSAFERRVLRGFMHDARVAGHFPTRRPKERPKTRSLQVKRGDTFESIVNSIVNADVPGLLHLPLLNAGAFLSGRPPLRGVEVVGTENIVYGRPPQEFMTSVGMDTIRNTVNLDVTAFSRMLAKIGYSYTVATRGVYPLTEVPVLPLILGSADDGSTWVGSAEFRLSAEDQGPQNAAEAQGLQHALSGRSLSLVVDGAYENVWVARVKLFADAGATGYEVVVRRARQIETPRD